MVVRLETVLAVAARRAHTRSSTRRRSREVACTSIERRSASRVLQGLEGPPLLPCAEHRQGPSAAHVNSRQPLHPASTRLTLAISVITQSESRFRDNAFSSRNPRILIAGTLATETPFLVYAVCTTHGGPKGARAVSCGARDRERRSTTAEQPRRRRRHTWTRHWSLLRTCRRAR